MSRTGKNLPIALTIAGSDSGGGAGIQADLKTFAALGVHGTSALTCVTAQNPRRVMAIQPCRPEIVRAQLEALFAELPPAAIKIGMLYSAAIVRVVSEFLEGRRRRMPPVVLDPVLISTSGRRLLEVSAVGLMQRRLFPLASLLTPNVPEAEMLLGRRLICLEDLRRAARELHSNFGCAALVKGGHLRGGREAADVFYDGKDELLLAAPRIRNLRTHGTGCAYSAAIAALLARGRALPEAVAAAKHYITRAIALHGTAAGHAVLRY